MEPISIDEGCCKDVITTAAINYHFSQRWQPSPPLMTNGNRWLLTVIVINCAAGAIMVANSDNRGPHQQDHVHNVSSQLQVYWVQIVDLWEEGLQRKATQCAILRCGKEVPLSVEDLCGHSHETIAIKGAWISVSTMMLWHHFCSTSDAGFPNLGPAWLV